MPEWSWIPHSDRVNGKKQQFLKMARKGETRPFWKTELGIALLHYTSPNDKSYDPEFDRAVRELAPHWFIDTANENKELLLKMAQMGKSKPSWKNKLGTILVNYTCKASGSYDPEFDREIRKSAPKWFVRTTDENKRKLLKIAQKREPRPNAQKTQLGSALCSYTRKNSSSYDSKFDRQIRALAPHWFIDTAKENKEKLLEMAHAKKPRPHQKTRLGLCDYLNKNSSSYDPEFDKAIRKLAPHWFVDTAKRNKSKLLKMAREGKARPNCKKTKLGSVLTNYISKNSNCYDSEFNSQVRQLAPAWFAKIADENRKKLLEMARKGKSRPAQKTKLASALTNYTRRGSDNEFDTEIRQLAPHWFKRAS